MAWNVYRCGKAVVIRCGCECNMDCISVFSDMIDAILKRGHCSIVLDMSDVKYIDSSFLGQLAVSLKRVRYAEGGLEIACLRPHILDVFRTICYDRLFRNFQSVEKAAESFGFHTESSDSDQVPVDTPK